MRTSSRATRVAGATVFTATLVAGLAFGGGCAATGSSSSGGASSATPDARPSDPTSTGDAGVLPATPDPDPAFAAVFPPSTALTATPSSLFGLWSGYQAPHAPEPGGNVIVPDMRLQLSATSITIAESCACCANIAVLPVKATVSASSIKSLETKTGGGGASGLTSCTVSVNAVEIVRCQSTTPAAAEAESATLDAGCFFLSGMTLNFYRTALLGGANLTKLSD